MKPAPRASLLPAGHRWCIVPAAGWTFAEAGNRLRCTHEVARDGGFVTHCLSPSVAYETTKTRLKTDKAVETTRTSYRCVEHLGSIRWIHDGQVWAWRAFPIGVAA